MDKNVISQTDKEKVKELIKELHDGAEVAEVKNRFKEVIDKVTASGLAEIENELIKEGLPETEVKRLCDVHLSVFLETLEPGAVTLPQSKEGHPLHTFTKENEAIDEVVLELKPILNKLKEHIEEDLIFAWKEKHNMLMDLEKHYSRKENLLFPFLEEYNFMGPSQVMWAIHDDIRKGLKATNRFLDDIIVTHELPPGKIDQEIFPLLTMITEMISKEKNILFPASLEKLSNTDWYNIEQESDEIGYCLYAPTTKWIPEGVETLKTEISENFIKLETGVLTLKQLELLFEYVPMDLTFVDENDIVRFFSNHPRRIFVRTKAIIGRSVQNCHPPKSVHIVEQILDDFRANKRDVAGFLLKLNGLYLHIRYFAVRDADGVYVGCLETTQDITLINKFEGEVRLLNIIE